MSYDFLVIYIQPERQMGSGSSPSLPVRLLLSANLAELLMRRLTCVFIELTPHIFLIAVHRYQLLEVSSPPRVPHITDTTTYCTRHKLTQTQK
jgi:hypothetical protein